MRTDVELHNAFWNVPHAKGQYAALRAIYNLGRADAEKEAADALAAEKAAHEETLECLQRLRAEWLTVADAAGMVSTSEARDIARAIVGSRRNLAAATDRIARAALIALQHASVPWAREVLAALGQPAAEREGETARAEHEKASVEYMHGRSDAFRLMIEWAKNHKAYSDGQASGYASPATGEP